MQEVINQYTKLEAEKKYEAAHTLIVEAIEKNNMHDPELLWRRAFICRRLGRNNAELYKKYVYEGLHSAEEGLKLNPNHGKCNSWYAIFLNYASELEGIKKRIENSFKMKEHWLKALEIDPNDDATLHSLGRWCFEVTDLPWMQRQFAKAFFASPPTSTYEEGLKYLLAYEEKCTAPLCGNDLYLAKTYQRLKDKERAKHYCEKVLKYEEDDKEVDEAKKEVTAMLKYL